MTVFLILGKQLCSIKTTHRYANLQIDSPNY